MITTNKSKKPTSGIVSFAGYDEVLTTIARYILSNKLESTLKISISIGNFSLLPETATERIRLFGPDIPRRCLSGRDCFVPSARLEVHDFTGGFPTVYEREV